MTFETLHEMGQVQLLNNFFKESMLFRILEHSFIEMLSYKNTFRSDSMEEKLDGEYVFDYSK